MQKYCLGQEILDVGGPLMWQAHVPMDQQRPWDLRGAFLFVDIVRMHQRYCMKFVQSDKFKQYVHNVQTNLVIVDYFLQV